MPTLLDHLTNVTLAPPLTHGALTLVPLTGPDAGGPPYALASEAMDAGTLQVTEADDGATVPELTARNTGFVRVLLLDGEELVGAMQNRILNTTVLLPPKSVTAIPVSCVEQGRWRPASRGFRSDGHAPPHVRADAAPDVSANLRRRHRADADQGRVWDSVAKHLEAHAASSPTGAMKAARERHRDRLSDVVAALPWPAGARGVLAAIGGRLAALDLFDRAETLQKLWPRLVTGYALDALATRTPGGPAPEVDAAGVLAAAAEAPCTPCPSVGVGEDWRLEGKGLVGKALVADGACVHLSLFPDEHARGYDDGPRPEHGLEPPSRRRRHHDGERPGADQ